MPELPEVQTVINTLLNGKILNKEILGVKIFDKIILKNSSITNFIDFFIGEKITNISRKGKFLIFRLTRNKTFVAHLRMEGKFYFDLIKNQTEEKFLLGRFIFKKHSLDFFDFRKFGTFNIYHGETWENSKELKNVSIDPLDKTFNGEFLFKKTRNTKKKIKTMLLDQTIVSGIGNIYADEILFEAKIHPETIAGKLSLIKYNLIAESAKRIMMKAIDNKGTTIYSYKFNKKNTGHYQKYLKAYGKQGTNCMHCNSTIKKIKVNGRGTHFCPRCQKVKK